MKAKNIFYTVLFCIGVTGLSSLQAQDPHFSQYFSSPMTVNPALIGMGAEDWRVMANFRSQWWGGFVAPYNTTTVSLEKSIQSGGPQGKSNFGIGFSMLSDASNNGLLKNNYFSLGTAYHIALDAQGNEMLGLGMEATYANRLVDASKFEFQSQFGSMGFQRSVPSGDPVNIVSNNYLDVNVGVRYSKKIPGKWGYHLGGAIYHASTPKDGVFANTTYTLNRRISLQGGTVFYLTNQDEIHTSLLTDIQGENTIYTLGGVYKAKIKSSILEHLNLGLWNRFGDALYPYVGLEGKNWAIGFTYDAVIDSQLKNSYSSVQSMEFSLVWYLKSTRKTRIRENEIMY